MFKDIKEILKHSSVFGVSNFLKKGIGFIMIPIYTRYLTTSDYGVIELLDLINMIVIMLLGLKLGAGVVRYYVHYDDPDDKREVFTTALIIGIVVSVVFVCLGELLSAPITELFIGERDTETYVRILIVIIGLRIFSAVPENYLLACKRSMLMSGLSLATLFVSLSLNIYFLVVLHMGVMGIVLSMLIAKVFDTAIFLGATVRHTTISFSYQKSKELLKYTLPLIPAALALFAIHYSDRLFIRQYCDLSEVGVYSLGYKFGMILSTMVSGPFLWIWNTKRYEIAKRHGGETTISRIFTYYCFVLIFAALGISVLIEEIIFIMATAPFQNASSVTPLVVFGYVFMGISNFLGLGMMVTMKTKYYAYVQLCVAGLNVILNFFLISRFGIMGGALATFLTFASLAAITEVVSQKLFRVRYEYGRIAILFGVGIFIFIVSTLIDGAFWVTLTLNVLLLIGFPGFLVLGGFFRKEELDKARELMAGSFRVFVMYIRGRGAFAHERKS